MKRIWKFFAMSGVVLSGILAVNGLAMADRANKPTQAEFSQKVQKLQLPFIANEGQADERVKFYANTFGGTVYVTRGGEIVYSLPGSIKGDADRYTAGVLARYAHGRLPEYRSIIHPAFGILACIDTPCGKGLILKEEIVSGRIGEIKGGGKAITKVSYFKGNDQSKWKSGISTYESVGLGEVYKGIELKLKAYGNNVEKLFSEFFVTFNPGTNFFQGGFFHKCGRTLALQRVTQLVIRSMFNRVILHLHPAESHTFHCLLRFPGSAAPRLNNLSFN